MESESGTVTKQELDESLERFGGLLTDRITAKIDAKIDESEDRIMARVTAKIDARIDESEDRVMGRVMAKIDESAERVMNNVLHEMKLFRDHNDARFSAMEARLDRQAGLLQSGARAMLRFDRWSDNSDERMAALTAHVETLESRVTRLEGEG